MVVFFLSAPRTKGCQVFGIYSPYPPPSPSKTYSSGWNSIFLHAIVTLLPPSLPFPPRVPIWRSRNKWTSWTLWLTLSFSGKEARDMSGWEKAKRKDEEGWCQNSERQRWARTAVRRSSVVWQHCCSVAARALLASPLPAGNPLTASRDTSQPCFLWPLPLSGCPPRRRAWKDGVPMEQLCHRTTPNHGLCLSLASEVHSLVLSEKDHEQTSFEDYPIKNGDWKRILDSG